MPTNKYKSGFETKIAAQLTKAKVLFAYEPYSMVYFLKVSGAKCSTCGSETAFAKRRYVPDFAIIRGLDANVGDFIVEAKGKFTSAMRTKMLGVISANPDYDIRMVFMRDNWMTKKKLQKYSDWAEKHGIKYAIGEIPKSWIKEFKSVYKPSGKSGGGKEDSSENSGIDGKRPRRKRRGIG
jgi:hypothetical protein